MSTPTTVQSNLVPVALSTDNITYKTVVCKKSWNFNGDTPVNTEESDCGIHTGLGANTWTVDMELLLNTTINGATEVSAKEILAWWQAQTLLYIVMQYPTSVTPGTAFYIQGSGYITKYTLNNQVGNLITATVTFTGSSNPDVTP